MAIRSKNELPSIALEKPLRPAASAAVASVRPANDGADDSSRTAATPLLAASGNPPPTSSVTDPNAPVLWRGSFKIWSSLSFGVAFTGTNAALDHFEQCSPRGRAVWYWPNRALVISKQATVTHSLMATA